VKPLLRRILREPEVLQASGYRKTQLDLLIQQGKFPRPIRLSEGGRARGWFEDEVGPTRAQYEARRAAVYDIVAEQYPMNVRHAFYLATVRGLVLKTDRGTVTVTAASSGT
jgi:predicted DNA-binding transcriptional regulator AlpA